MVNHLSLKLWRMSNYFFKGLIIQFFCITMLFASGNAQKVSDLRQVVITVNFSGENIFSVIQKIEQLSDFKFAYNRADLKNAKNVTGDYKNESLYDILQQVSRQANVKFRQVNSSINVSLLDADKTTEKLIEIIQTRTVTGKVTSMEDEESIPGVNVLVKGSQRGTVTDLDGNYAIEVSTGEILVFSAVGFTTEEIEVGNQSVIDVVMAPDVQQLSEIVVIGYGEKSRKLLTESIGTVEAQELTKVPVASADAALQGRVSGVQITNVDGTPGSPVAVRIRGVGTVGNTQPLFVIDGIPVGSNAGATTNPLATINPSDIESVSVLKDASAAAVYGVRAANGVVLITTKRGKTGKPSISFDGYYGIQKIPELWDVLNVSQWTTLTQEAYSAFNLQNDLDPDDPSYLVLHPDVASGGDYTAEGLQRRGLPQPDWARDLINENAPMQNYNLAVSGANEDLNYHVSAGYFAQDAVVNKWDLERFTFRANSDYKIGSRFRFGENFMISYQNIVRGVNGGGDGFLLNNAATMPPFFQIYDLNNRIPNNRYGYDGNLNVAGLTIG